MASFFFTIARLSMVRSRYKLTLPRSRAGEVPAMDRKILIFLLIRLHFRSLSLLNRVSFSLILVTGFWGAFLEVAQCVCGIPAACLKDARSVFRDSRDMV